MTDYTLDGHRAPIYIKFMLTCFWSADPELEIGPSCWNSNAGVKVRRFLMEEGLIDMDLRPTDRGRAWVAFICNTPLPEPVTTWELPEGY
jgi:hypothetical protein